MLDLRLTVECPCPNFLTFELGKVLEGPPGTGPHRVKKLCGVGVGDLCCVGGGDLRERGADLGERGAIGCDRRIDPPLLLLLLMYPGHPPFCFWVPGIDIVAAAAAAAAHLNKKKNKLKTKR